MSSPIASPIPSPADPLSLSSSQSLDDDELLDDELLDDELLDDEPDEELPRTSLRAAPSLPACADPDPPSVPTTSTAKTVSHRHFTL